jgi:hypothetical protein
MSNNALQEILSKRFSRYTHTTNPSVWNAIEMQLNEKKSNRAAIWFWILNGLAASFLFGNQVPLDVKFLSNLGIETIQEKLPREGSNRAQTDTQTIAATDKNRMTKGYTKFTPDLNENGDKKDAASGESNEQPSLKSNPNILLENVPHITPTLATKSVQKLDQFSRNHEPNGEINLNVKSRFQPSIWAEIQSSYLLGIRSPESSVITLNSAQKPSLDRRFEFTCMSHIELSRRFSLGIGIGYADASIQASGQLVSASSILVKTDDYRQFNLVIPVQASYTLFAHRRFELNAGIVLQPEYAQLSVLSETEVTTDASISGFESLTTTESVMNLYKSLQFGIEPFAEASLSIHPRISVKTSIGYRSYLTMLTLDDYESESRNNITFNLGVQYRLK